MELFLMNEYCKNCFELTEKLENKIKECEELKAQIDLNKKESSQRFKILRVFVYNKSKRNAELSFEINRYRKALEEIVKYWYENEWNCYKCRIVMDKRLEGILNIINKTKKGRAMIANLQKEIIERVLKGKKC